MAKDVAFLKKLRKVNDEFTVTICENGYVVAVSGEDEDDTWINSKIVFDGVDEMAGEAARPVVDLLGLAVVDAGCVLGAQPLAPSRLRLCLPQPSPRTGQSR